MRIYKKHFSRRATTEKKQRWKRINPRTSHTNIYIYIYMYSEECMHATIFSGAVTDCSDLAYPIPSRPLSSLLLAATCTGYYIISRKLILPMLRYIYMYSIYLAYSYFPPRYPSIFGGQHNHSIGLHMIRAGGTALWPPLHLAYGREDVPRH